MLINVPAWLAHVIVPGAFALMSYRFAVAVVKGIVQEARGTKGRESG